MPDMTPEQVVDLIRGMQRTGATIWVDGGWCIDALVGRQTRPHLDLDIAIEASDTELAVDYLIARNFHLVVDHDSKPWNFVFRHLDSRQVDFHVFCFDQTGNGTYGPAENGELYPAAGLKGEGSIDGYPVQCISLATAVSFRTGFHLRPQDCADLLTLHHQFGIELPEDFHRYCTSHGQ